LEPFEPDRINTRIEKQLFDKKKGFICEEWKYGNTSRLSGWVERVQEPLSRKILPFARNC
jgi:hypothetical protein